MRDKLIILTSSRINEYFTHEEYFNRNEIFSLIYDLIRYAQLIFKHWNGNFSLLLLHSSTLLWMLQCNSWMLHTKISLTICSWRSILPKNSLSAKFTYVKFLWSEQTEAWILEWSYSRNKVENKKSFPWINFERRRRAWFRYRVRILEALE